MAGEGEGIARVRRGWTGMVGMHSRQTGPPGWVFPCPTVQRALSHVEHLRPRWLALMPPADRLASPNRSRKADCFMAAATLGAWLARPPSSPVLNCITTVPLLQGVRMGRVGARGGSWQKEDKNQRQESGSSLKKCTAGLQGPHLLAG